MARALASLLLTLAAMLPQQVRIPGPGGAPATGGGPVAFGTNGGSVKGSNNTTVTLNLSTIATGTNLVAWCDAVWGHGGSPTVTSVTWNSTGMTSAGAAASASGTNAQTFYLVAPTTGTGLQAVLTLSATETGDLWLSCFTTTGTNQTTPVRSGSYTTTTSSTSIVVTSQTNDMTHTATGNQTGVNPTTNQTKINGGTNTAIGFADDHAAGASSVTHTWSAATAIEGFSIQP